MPARAETVTEALPILGMHCANCANTIQRVLVRKVEGVSQADAETLVQAYQDDCPIYRLASEGSEVSMKVTAK